MSSVCVYLCLYVLCPILNHNKDGYVYIQTLSKSSVLFGIKRSTKESCGPDIMFPLLYIMPPLPSAVFCNKTKKNKMGINKC